MPPAHPPATARLAFRTWRDDDGELAVALWGDADVARYITAFDGPPSRASCLERLHRELACQAEHGFQYWPAFLPGGELVGCAGLRPYRDGVLELGVHLRPAHWRRGYADELGRAVIAHAFALGACPHCSPAITPANAASRGMLAKLGFRYDHDELYPPTAHHAPVVSAGAAGMMRRTAAVIVVAATATASAQDEFEIQVYDVETAVRGDPGIEVHVNEHLLPGPDQTHVTFEPHYGLRQWLELGGYFQTSVSTTGDVEYAGVKLRAKLRWPRRLWCERLGLAINFELSDVPPVFEPNQWGSEIRPIADLYIGRLYAAINLIILDSTSPPRSQAAREFEPAAKLAVVLSPSVMVGAEVYGGFGPIDALGADEDVVRGYAVVDLKGSWWDLNLGVGATRGIGDHPVAKLIFGAHPKD